MKLITITRGKFAEVDDEDFLWLSQWKWQCDFYDHVCRREMRQEKYVVVWMHREIMRLGLRTQDPRQVEHRDRNGLNNQKSNLRLSTQRENCCNLGVRSDNTSGFKGVSWQAGIGRWKVQISIEGRNRYLTTCESKTIAAWIYDCAALEFQGEFAVLNFPRKAAVPLC